MGGPKITVGMVGEVSGIVVAGPSVRITYQPTQEEK